MMMQPIFDMHAVAVEELITDDPSPGILDRLVSGWACADAAIGAQVRAELLERADAYDHAQPSFAADLRAAAMRDDELAPA